MKIRVELDVDLPGRRIGLLLCLVASVGGVASAHATWLADTSWIGAGKPVSAASLSALVTEADERLVALEARPITRARTSSTTEILADTPKTVVFETIDFGSNLNINTGDYTCPRDGKYRVGVSVKLESNGMWNEGASSILKLYKGTASYADIANTKAPGVTTTTLPIAGTTLVDCMQGETLHVAVLLQYSSGQINHLSGESGANWITFEWLGE